MRRLLPRTGSLVLLPIAALVLGACGSAPRPPVVAPTTSPSSSASVSSFTAPTSVGWSPSVSEARVDPRLHPAPRPGSLLTTVATGHRSGPMGFTTTRDALVLVRPTGGTRTIVSWAVRRTAFSDRLVDWSQGGAVALVTRTLGRRSAVMRVDVRTGRMIKVDVPRRVDGAVLTADGTGFVAEVSDGVDGTEVDAVTWHGQVRRLDAVGGETLLRGRGDTVLVGGGSSTSLVTVDTTTGQQVHSVDLPGFCTPVRWWNATRVLMACDRQVVLVDPTTGARRVLVPGRGRGDDAHLDVRHVASGWYVQVAGACGLTFVDHEASDGTLHEVRVPGAVGNVMMVGATTRGRLVVEHATGCGGGQPRSALGLLDPVTGQERTLLAVRPDQMLGRVIGYGEVSASSP